MNIKKIAGLVFRLLAAVILLQTLWFKFSGHPESVTLFTKLGVEPWGRIFTGIVELIAGLLLIIRPTAVLGALVAIGLMLGAIASHFLVLGIESAGDGGQLFTLAWIVLVLSIIVAILYREDLKKYPFIPNFMKHFV